MCPTTAVTGIMAGELMITPSGSRGLVGFFNGAQALCPSGSYKGSPGQFSGSQELPGDRNWVQAPFTWNHVCAVDGLFLSAVLLAGERTYGARIIYGCPGPPITRFLPYIDDNLFRVTGGQLEVRVAKSGPGRVRIEDISYWHGGLGAMGNKNGTIDFGEEYAYQTFGGPDDLWGQDQSRWRIFFNDAPPLTTPKGIRVRVKEQGVASATAFIDHVIATVFFEPL